MSIFSNKLREEFDRALIEKERATAEEHRLQRHLVETIMRMRDLGAPPEAIDALTNNMRHGIMGGRGGVGGVNMPRPPNYTLAQKIEMRMNWPNGKHPFARMTTHEGTDKVLVWVVNKDNSYVVIEDDIGLFPSDTLITKLRILDA